MRRNTRKIFSWQLREHYQKRDRLRLIVDYRKKFLDSFVRGEDEEAKQAHLTPTLSPSDAERENAKLTAAINRAKDNGYIATLREIADDPHGFILRQGWTGLDFSDGAELAQLRRLHETLQLEIITVIEALNRLRESPDYELCQLSERKPGMLEELAAEQARLLAKESGELEKEAARLAGEIEELSGGEKASRIA